MLKNCCKMAAQSNLIAQEAVFQSEERLEILAIKMNALIVFSYYVLAKILSLF